MQKTEQMIAKLNACIAANIEANPECHQLISSITIDLNGRLNIYTTDNEHLTSYSYSNFSQSVATIARNIVKDVVRELTPVKPTNKSSKSVLPQLMALGAGLGVNICEYL